MSDRAGISQLPMCDQLHMINSSKLTSYMILWSQIVAHTYLSYMVKVAVSQLWQKLLVR
jgi:hypothetical protein